MEILRGYWPIFRKRNRVITKLDFKTYSDDNIDLYKLRMRQQLMMSLKRLNELCKCNIDMIVRVCAVTNLLWLLNFLKNGKKTISLTGWMLSL